MKPRGFSVATRCETVEEFIAMFHERTTGDTMFVHAVDKDLVGLECGFAILLADLRPVLAGTCVVLDAFTDGNNPYKRAGMRIRICRLGPDSKKVFTALEAARELEEERTTLVFDEPDTLVRPPRTPRGTEAPPVTPPAQAPTSFGRPQTNPLGELSDASLDGLVECRLYELDDDKPLP